MLDQSAIRNVKLRCLSSRPPTEKIGYACDYQDVNAFPHNLEGAEWQDSCPRCGRLSRWLRLHSDNRMVHCYDCGIYRDTEPVLSDLNEERRARQAKEVLRHKRVA